jgi:outer membrane receptor protein involved in Fe transport
VKEAALLFLAVQQIGRRGRREINASISARIDPGVTVSLFGRNLTKTKYFQRVTNLQTTGFLNAYPGDPRTYGVSASLEF